MTILHLKDPCRQGWYKNMSAHEGLKGYSEKCSTPGQCVTFNEIL